MIVNSCYQLHQCMPWLFYHDGSYLATVSQNKPFLLYIVFLRVLSQGNRQRIQYKNYLHYALSVPQILCFVDLTQLCLCLSHKNLLSEEPEPFCQCSSLSAQHSAQGRHARYSEWMNESWERYDLTETNEYFNYSTYSRSKCKMCSSIILCLCCFWFSNTRLPLS